MSRDRRSRIEYEGAMEQKRVRLVTSRGSPYWGILKDAAKVSIHKHDS